MQKNEYENFHLYEIINIYMVSNIIFVKLSLKNKKNPKILNVFIFLLSPLAVELLFLNKNNSCLIVIDIGCCNINIHKPRKII